jgi:hypothetical protein
VPSIYPNEPDEDARLNTTAASMRRLTYDRYTSGLENFLSVLDAERSVYAAEDQLVRSEKNTAVTLIAVYKALGGGWSPAGPSSLVGVARAARVAAGMGKVGARPAGRRRSRNPA